MSDGLNYYRYLLLYKSLHEMRWYGLLSIAVYIVNNTSQYQLTGEQEVLFEEKQKAHLKNAAAMRNVSNRTSNQTSSNNAFPKQRV